MGLHFKWDEAKAASNITKHKVSFDEAKEVFADDLSLTVKDGDHSVKEERLLTIGKSSKNRILVVCHTATVSVSSSSSQNGGTHEVETIRIYSAREATRTEKKQYEG